MDPSFGVLADLAYQRARIDDVAFMREGIPTLLARESWLGFQEACGVARVGSPVEQPAETRDCVEQPLSAGGRRAEFRPLQDGLGLLQCSLLDGPAQDGRRSESRLMEVG